MGAGQIRTLRVLYVPTKMRIPPCRPGVSHVPGSGLSPAAPRPVLISTAFETRQERKRENRSVALRRFAASHRRRRRRADTSEERRGRHCCAFAARPRRSPRRTQQVERCHGGGGKQQRDSISGGYE